MNIKQQAKPAQPATRTYEALSGGKCERIVLRAP